MNTEGSFFKRLPSFTNGVRVVLLDNQYYWVVPPYMYLAYNRVRKNYILGCCCNEVGIDIKVSTAKPTIDWIKATVSVMVDALDKVDRLYYRTVPEKINIRPCTIVPRYVFSTPILARKLLGEPNIPCSNVFHNPKERILVLADITARRDRLLNFLKASAKITPQTALTFPTENPQSLIVKHEKALRVIYNATDENNNAEFTFKEDVQGVPWGA